MLNNFDIDIFVFKCISVFFVILLIGAFWNINFLHAAFALLFCSFWGAFEIIVRMNKHIKKLEKEIQVSKEEKNE